MGGERAPMASGDRFLVPLGQQHGRTCFSPRRRLPAAHLCLITTLRPGRFPCLCPVPGGTPWGLGRAPFGDAVNSHTCSLNWDGKGDRVFHINCEINVELGF